MNTSSWFAAVATVLSHLSPAFAQLEKPQVKDAPSYTTLEDVIYGRSDGPALTMDVIIHGDKDEVVPISQCCCREYAGFSASRTCSDGTSTT